MEKVLIIGLMFLTCITQAQTESSSQSEFDPLSRLVADACEKQVVLLGEDAHHGSGTTMNVKIQIVKRLIEECGFTGLVFESSVYEFLHVESEIQKGNFSEQTLAQAIGGIWNIAKPMHPFMSYLQQQARKGKLFLAGIDAQFSANQPFSQKKLPKRLARYLNEARQLECQTELLRFLNWQYSKLNPYNEQTKNRIESCVVEIKDVLKQLDSNDKGVIQDKLMTANFYDYLQFPKGHYFNLRDKRMADNLSWHISNRDENTKMIVWNATVHAAKKLPKGDIPMGQHLHKLYGNDVFSIGFSALSGQFGRNPEKVKEITPSGLEQHAFASSKQQLEYLSASQLANQGQIAAQALRYQQVDVAVWSNILDGLIVLRKEEALAL